MYITVEELGVPEDMLIRLTDDEGSGMVNAERAEAAIEAASARIDAALAGRRDTPLAKPGGLIKALTRDLAVHSLYLRVGKVPEDVAAAFRAASDMLDKASLGIFHLGISDDAPGPEFSYRDRMFARELMEGL